MNTLSLKHISGLDESSIRSHWEIEAIKSQRAFLSMGKLTYVASIKMGKNAFNAWLVERQQHISKGGCDRANITSRFIKLFVVSERISEDRFDAITWQVIEAVKKLLYPLYVASVVFAVVLFTVPYGRTVWHYWVLRVTQGSVYLAALILVKVLVCVSLLLVLVSTTKMYDIVSAFTWLPNEVVEITLLMLRYIETLSHTSTRLHMAAKARGAFSKKLPFYKRISNLGSLAGVLILRAMDRADRVYTSMIARGYKGKLVVNKKLELKVLLQVVVVFILCVAAIYVDRFILKAPYVLS